MRRTIPLCQMIEVEKLKHFQEFLSQEDKARFEQC